MTTDSMLLWFGCTWMAMFFALACFTLAFLAVRKEVRGLRREVENLKK
jgi:protein-S-isoprenylcysteine O-methyltransferase Ste14